MRKLRVLAVLLVSACFALCVLGTGRAKAEPFTLGNAMDRPDRLIVLSGDREEKLLADCRAAEGEGWRVATVYVGVGPDDWRVGDQGERNEEIVEGRLPEGSEACVWNYWFDLDMPVEGAAFRLRSVGTGDVVFEQAVDLSGVGDVFVVDCRNLEALAVEPIGAPWGFEASARQRPWRRNGSPNRPRRGPALLRKRPRRQREEWTGEDAYPTLGVRRSLARYTPKPFGLRVAPGRSLWPRSANAAYLGGSLERTSARRIADESPAGFLRKAARTPPLRGASVHATSSPRRNLTLRFTREVAKADDRYPIYRYLEADAEPIVLSPGLSGWHRIYVGTEVQTSFQLSLSKEGIKYPVPEYFAGESYSRLLQDYLVTCADLTDQDVCIGPGGARYWRDVSIRYIRFVPMTEEEVRVRQETLQFAREHGRPFAAYVESVTPCHYQPRTLKLRDHVRNQMRLHKKRGCTDVYVHVIRLGSQAWYHSDVVERYLPDAPETGDGDASAASDDPDHPASKWRAWMEQGDPLGVSVEEARAAGLKVLPDMGMNVSYEDQRDRLIREHPEYLVGGKGIFLDYRRPEVRGYALRVAAELLTKYDVDGIHLDYARFAANTAFDTDALLDVGRRIHEVRRQAEAKWGHPLIIAARIPSYRYHERQSSVYTGDYAEFLDALKVWAREGWVDRVMVCGMGHVGHLRTISLERYAQAVKGTDTVLWGDLYGGGAFPNTATSEWLDVARTWTQQGLNGGFFFYAIDRPMEFFDLDWRLRLVDYPAQMRVLRR